MLTPYFDTFWSGFIFNQTGIDKMTGYSISTKNVAFVSSTFAIDEEILNSAAKI